MSISRLMHNVFFTLKDNSPEKVDGLVKACKKFLNVQAGIVYFSAGPVCRELKREVNDLDWDVGLHITFVNKEAHDAYQEDTTHNEFIAEMRYNWAKVRVFDSYV